MLNFVTGWDVMSKKLIIGLLLGSRPARLSRASVTGGNMYKFWLLALLVLVTIMVSGCVVVPDYYPVFPFHFTYRR